MKNIIKKYLDNQLDDKESEAFTRLLVRSIDRDHQRIRLKQVLLDDWGISRDEKNIKASSKWKKRWLWPLIGVAAALLLVIGVLTNTWTRQPTPTQYADQYLAANYFDNAAPRKNGNAIEKRNAFDQAYYEQRYPKVQDIGEEMMAQNVAKTREVFFTGLSYLYDGNPVRAVEILQSIVTASSDTKQNWQEEAQWFLALAFIQAKQENDARKVLLNIQPNEWNYQRAQELLDYLSSLE